MIITEHQRTAYQQALEAWKQAAHEAQKTRDHAHAVNTTPENIYLITDDDIRLLQKESEAAQRLIGIVRNM